MLLIGILVSEHEFQPFRRFLLEPLARPCDRRASHRKQRGEAIMPITQQRALNKLSQIFRMRG